MKNKILTGIVLLLPLSFSMAKESTVSQFCLLQPETETAQCLADEYAKYDLKLNNNYKEIMKNLSANDKKAFKTQQIEWIKEKEKRCAPLANENGKQACLLDATVLKNNQLEDKLIDVMPKVFEGDWRVKYSNNKINPKDYDTYEYDDIDGYGGAGDDGFTIIENDKNICGIQESYSRHSYDSISFEGKVLDWNTAQTEHIFKGVSTDKLIDNKTIYITFRVCDGKLYTHSSEDRDNYKKSEIFTCQQLKKSDKQNEHGLSQKTLSIKDKLQFIKDNPWIESCLNAKEKK